LYGAVGSIDTPKNETFPVISVTEQHIGSTPNIACVQAVADPGGGKGGNCPSLEPKKRRKEGKK